MLYYSYPNGTTASIRVKHVFDINISLIDISTRSITNNSASPPVFHKITKRTTQQDPALEYEKTIIYHFWGDGENLFTFITIIHVLCLYLGERKTYYTSYNEASIIVHCSKNTTTLTILSLYTAS